jgi:hypothetical protein
MLPMKKIFMIIPLVIEEEIKQRKMKTMMKKIKRIRMYYIILREELSDQATMAITLKEILILMQMTITMMRKCQRTNKVKIRLI